MPEEQRSPAGQPQLRITPQPSSMVPHVPSVGQAAGMHPHMPLVQESPGPQ
jgi:hypothetical protein